MKEELKEPDRFTNKYKCSECGAEWQDDSPYTNNDRCPDCDTEIEPFESIDLNPCDSCDKKGTPECKHDTKKHTCWK
jgi:peptide subunit release factor 1 (eRF1)